MVNNIRNLIQKKICEKLFTKIFLFFCILLNSNLVFSDTSHPEKKLEVLNPSFKLAQIKYSDGTKEIVLNDNKSHFLILNFWATWCPACVAEMKSLDALAIKGSERNLKVIAVNLNEGGPSEVNSFLKKMKLRHTKILFDAKNKSYKNFGIRGLPTTFLISPEGNVIAKLEGATNWDSQALDDQIFKIIDNSK